MEEINIFANCDGVFHLCQIYSIFLNGRMSHFLPVNEFSRYCTNNPRHMRNEGAPPPPPPKNLPTLFTFIWDDLKIVSTPNWPFCIFGSRLLEKSKEI
jgi:hypothetical protein